MYQRTITRGTTRQSFPAVSEKIIYSLIIQPCCKRRSQRRRERANQGLHEERQPGLAIRPGLCSDKKKKKNEHLADCYFTSLGETSGKLKNLAFPDGTELSTKSKDFALLLPPFFFFPLSSLSGEEQRKRKEREREREE